MVCSWLRSGVDAAGELERVVALFDDDEQAATEHRSATTAIVAKADLNNFHQVLLPAAVDEIDTRDQTVRANSAIDAAVSRDTSGAMNGKISVPWTVPITWRQRAD